MSAGKDGKTICEEDAKSFQRNIHELTEWTNIWQLILGVLWDLGVLTHETQS